MYARLWRGDVMTKVYQIQLFIPTKSNSNFCAPARIRTWDPISISDVLYQLSYKRIFISSSIGQKYESIDNDVPITISKKQSKNKPEGAY